MTRHYIIIVVTSDCCLNLNKFLLVLFSAPSFIFCDLSILCILSTLSTSFMACLLCLYLGCPLRLCLLSSVTYPLFMPYLLYLCLLWLVLSASTMAHFVCIFCGLSIIYILSTLSIFFIAYSIYVFYGLFVACPLSGPCLLHLCLLWLALSTSSMAHLLFVFYLLCLCFSWLALSLFFVACLIYF